jgi:hypothetical protein
VGGDALVDMGSNLRFDMSATFTANYSFIERQRSSNTLLLTDFVNLKIKSVQFSDVLIAVEGACICS